MRSVGTPLRGALGSALGILLAVTAVGAVVERADRPGAGPAPRPTGAVQPVASPARFTVTRPGAGSARLGILKRPDGRWWAAVAGTTTGSGAPAVATTPAPPAPPSGSTLPEPAATFDDASRSFAVPVDLSAYAAASPAPRRVSVEVADDDSSEVVDTVVYTQTPTAVRSVATPLPGTRRVSLSSRVTDQYGQPVTGAVVRLAGRTSGSGHETDEVAVTDGSGVASFAGPGYLSGFYTAYVDRDLDGVRTGREPAYESVVGTVSFAAPGKSFFHDNTRIAGAGGVLADSATGTRAAAARGYRWIDQDGQLSYRTHAALRRGVRRVSSPAHLTWVNAHGSPFNPRWLGRGRFETRSWQSVRRHPGLRDALLTFRQNAAHDISVEWEVKDIKPFTTPSALDAAFANLATAAQRSYGSAWRSRVQVKVLSNLSGGRAFAFAVLRAAHARGFTTLYLARGSAARRQLPASAHAYVTYVRGARAGIFAPVPPTSQDLPIVVTGPPA